MGPLITDTAIPQLEGTGTLYVPAYFGITRGNFNSRGRREGAGGNFLSLSVPVQVFYGIAPRTEVNMIVPYRHKWASDLEAAGPGGEQSAGDGGIGDVTAKVKYLLAPEAAARPAVSAVIVAGFPTGRHRSLNPALLGTDSLEAALIPSLPE